MLGEAFTRPEQQMIYDFQNCRGVSIDEIFVRDAIHKVSLLHDSSQLVKIAVHLPHSVISTWCANSRGSINQNGCFISATAQRQVFDSNLIGFESNLAPLLFGFSLVVGLLQAVCHLIRVHAVLSYFLLVKQVRLLLEQNMFMLISHLFFWISNF